MKPTAASAKRAVETDALFTQLQRRLVENGDWERMRVALERKLNDCGWIDDMKHQGKERARNADVLSFQELLNSLSPHGQNALPVGVKREVLTIIRQFIEKQLE